MRRMGAIGVLALVLWTGTNVPTDAAAPSRSPLPSPASHLDILLTAAPDLSRTTNAALIAEADGIWTRAGIRIRWQAAVEPENSAAPRLRVLVVHRPAVSAPRSDGRVAVGELLRFGKGRAVAMASITTALQMLADGWMPIALRPPALENHRLGVVLGRAVAHEIGHYLLDTNEHARSGLMRATFEAREFTDLRTTSFSLDASSVSWVQDRLRRGMALGPRGSLAESNEPEPSDLQ